MRVTVRKLGAIGVAALYGLWSVVAAHGYAFNEIVPMSANRSAFREARPAGARAPTDRRRQPVFSLEHVLGSNPTTILTQNQTPLAA